MESLRSYFCYFYIVLWMLYYLQDMLRISGLFAQLILVVVVFISFYAFFEVGVHYKTCPFLKWLNVMLLALTIYGLIPIIGGWTLVGRWQQEAFRSYVYLQNIYTSILPIYAFYYFTLKRQISERNTTYLFYAFLAFSILAYYQRYFSFSEQSGMEEITNNMGYFFVPLIPMLQLIRLRDWWKYLFLIIIFIYIMMAMKRGAILTGIVMSILFLYYHFKGISIKKASYVLILSIIVIFIAFKYTSNLYDNSSYFKIRVEETKSGNTSNREDIFRRYFEYFVNKTTPTEFIVGNGANATIALLGEYAHNDWLEFAINQGIIGVSMYLVYWILLFLEWKNYRGPTYNKQTLGSIIVAYFMISLFSMSIENMPIAATLCIGYCLALNVRHKQIETLNGR